MFGYLKLPQIRRKQMIRRQRTATSSYGSSEHPFGISIIFLFDQTNCIFQDRRLTWKHKRAAAWEPELFFCHSEELFDNLIVKIHQRKHKMPLIQSVVYFLSITKARRILFILYLYLY